MASGIEGIPPDTHLKPAIEQLFKLEIKAEDLASPTGKQVRMSKLGTTVPWPCS